MLWPRAIGTLARYAVSGFVQKWSGSGFPWGTLAVNFLGCFLFGLVWALAEDRFLISGQTRTILLVGFMGAFTTFSTFAFETEAMLRDAEWLLATTNAVCQNVGGLVAVFLGLIAGRFPRDRLSAYGHGVTASPTGLCLDHAFGGRYNSSRS